MNKYSDHGMMYTQYSQHIHIYVTKFRVLFILHLICETSSFASGTVTEKTQAKYIPAWISNHMPGKVWDEITYPFLNFNGCTVEV